MQGHALPADRLEHFFLFRHHSEVREIGVGMKNEWRLADAIERGANACAILPMTDAREDRIEWSARCDLTTPTLEQIDVAVVRIRDLRGEVREVRDPLEELRFERPRERFARHEIVSHE